MSTIGSQTVTVNSEDRTYNPGWAAKYAGDLKRGNTAIKKCAITGGSSILRFTHDEKNGVERHILSLEDRISPVSTEDEEQLDKIQITLTCKANDSAAATRLTQLAIGAAAYVQSAGVLDSIFAEDL